MTLQNKSMKSRWALWLFPLFAVILTAWLFLDYFKQRGELIYIAFEEASSIQPEKTRVRFRGVDIGVVKDVTIADDFKGVVAHVRLERSAKIFASSGAKFWIVIPKVNFQGVSGLETIVEGTYIAASPGKGDDKIKHFKGSVGANSSDPLEDTVPYYLETDQLGSVSVDDAITFRGVKIGSVTHINLTKSAQTVIITINVENRFTRLIRANTVFWRKVGVHAKLGLFNSEVKINSLDSLLHGGIDIFTPTNVGEIAKAHTKFPLLAGPPKGVEKWSPVLEFERR